MTELESHNASPTPDSYGSLSTSEETTQPPHRPSAAVRAARTRRRWKVGGLLLLGIVLAIPAVRYAREYRQRQHERELVENTIEAVGGTARYWEGHVVQLAFGGPRFRATALERLREFPQLKRMVFIHVPLTATQLGPLRDAPQLEELVFMNVPIGDDALRTITICQQLRYLHLSQTNITSAGPKQLARLPALRRLDLKGNGLEEGSLRHLAALQQLEQLNLHEPKFTAAMIEELRMALPRTTVRP